MKKKIHKTVQNNCKPNIEGKIFSFQGIINRYKSIYQKDNELTFYKNLPNLMTTIENAAHAKMGNGKRHPHQYRLKGEALNEVFVSLTDSIELIKPAQSFEELFEIINKSILKIVGIGELMVYDTALRVGAFLGLHPEKVYLHRGAKQGAKSLGIGKGKRAVEVSEFPKEFHGLRAYEIEDCLCIYKEHLALIMKAQNKEH